MNGGTRGVTIDDSMGNTLFEGFIKNVPIKVNHEKLKVFAAMIALERFITVKVEIL